MPSIGDTLFTAVSQCEDSIKRPVCEGNFNKDNVKINIRGRDVKLPLADSPI